jgi:HAD superfamily hydrolase (TIGR01490 family)
LRYDKIVFTDLDGTLTLKDTYSWFLFKFITLFNILSNIDKILKIALLYFIKRYNSDDVKINTFKIFFTGINISTIRKKIPYLINNIKWNKTTIKAIKDLQDRGYKVFIVTASPDLYIQDLSTYLGYDGYIATKAIVKDGVLLGQFDGNICNFDNKPARIKALFDLENSHTVSFGNSKGDVPMLKLCNLSYYVYKNSIKKFN